MPCLANWERFLHDRTFPPLVHAQLEAIHPFLDGNGRVGRLFIRLLFVQRSVLSSPLLYRDSPVSDLGLEAHWYSLTVWATASILRDTTPIGFEREMCPSIHD